MSPHRERFSALDHHAAGQTASVLGRVLISSLQNSLRSGGHAESRTIHEIPRNVTNKIFVLVRSRGFVDRCFRLPVEGSFRIRRLRRLRRLRGDGDTICDWLCLMPTELEMEADLLMGLGAIAVPVKSLGVQSKQQETSSRKPKGRVSPTSAVTDKSGWARRSPLGRDVQAGAVRQSNHSAAIGVHRVNLEVAIARGAERNLSACVP